MGASLCVVAGFFFWHSFFLVNKLHHVFVSVSAFSATRISISVHGVLLSTCLIETQWRGKAREKVIDSSQHKGPQETAGKTVNE